MDLKELHANWNAEVVEYLELGKEQYLYQKTHGHRDRYWWVPDSEEEKDENERLESAKVETNQKIDHWAKEIADHPAFSYNTTITRLDIHRPTGGILVEAKIFGLKDETTNERAGHRLRLQGVEILLDVDGELFSTGISFYDRHGKLTGDPGAVCAPRGKVFRGRHTVRADYRFNFRHLQGEDGAWGTGVASPIYSPGRIEELDFGGETYRLPKKDKPKKTPEQKLAKAERKLESILRQFEHAQAYRPVMVSHLQTRVDFQRKKVDRLRDVVPTQAASTVGDTWSISRKAFPGSDLIVLWKSGGSGFYRPVIDQDNLTWNLFHFRNGRPMILVDRQWADGSPRRQIKAWPKKGEEFELIINGHRLDFTLRSPGLCVAELTENEMENQLTVG